MKHPYTHSPQSQYPLIKKNSNFTDMDRSEEELMSFGFFATIKETFKIIFSWKKIFTQIAFSLILPLSIVFLTQIQVSSYFFRKLNREEWHRDYSWRDSNYTMIEHFDKMIASDQISLYLIKIVFFVLTLIFSLLSTAAVVYTIGSIYTSEPVAYKKIMSVVPRVWKRLMITFLWGSLILFLFNSVSGMLFYAWSAFLGFSPFGIFIFIVLLLLYLSASIYISVVWHVACVVSVLEEDRGYKALVKGKNLVKGKLGISLFIFFLIFVFYVGTLIVYQVFVAYYWFFYNWLIGLACLIFLIFVVLFELVAQTMIYFVCKSYHHESINRPALADHLEEYYGYEMNSKSEKGIQMDQVTQVQV